MEQTISLLALGGLSSVGAYIMGIRGLGLKVSGLRAAISRFLECVGMTVIFFFVNLIVGMVAILSARSVMRGFVSLYLLNDVTLLVISLFQSLTFQWWRELSQGPTKGGVDFKGAERRTTR